MSGLINFSRLWEEGIRTITHKGLFGSKTEVVKEEELKKRVWRAKYQVRKQIDKLSYVISKLKERDETLFNRLIDVIMARDELRAKMLANEIAELRKVIKSLVITQVVLEKVEARLELFLTIGEVASTLAPIVPVIKMLKSEMIRVVPEIGLELGKLQEELEEALSEASFYTALEGDTILTSEARKIYEEAKIVAEQQIKEELPEITFGKQKTKQ